MTGPTAEDGVTSVHEGRGSMIEGALALCAEVLDLESVALSDNFLDLGGDSFSAIELAARLTESCDCEINVDDLFVAETFSELFQSKL